ncbi:MAG: signal peptidase II [Kiritimatiellia bacterium]
MKARFWTSAAVVVGLVLADQTVKGLAHASFPTETDCHTVIGGFFHLRCLHNTGCAWSMFEGHVWPLAIFGLVVLGVLVWKRRAIFEAGLSGARLTVSLVGEKLLYGGILGNVIDRIFRGAVIDMFDFQFGDYHYPCFNLADAYICVAAGLLVLLSFLPKPQDGAARA